MAEKFTVKALKRSQLGKNANTRLRNEGKVPIVIYGGGSEAISASADLKDLAAIIRSETGVNTVFTLEIEGDGAHDVIFQDRQVDPVTGRLVHADLRRFARGEKIEMQVPIHLVGNAAGLNEEGAVLTQSIREITVYCEPTKAPEFIEVDVSNLEAGHAIHVSDLKVAEGVEIHESPETVVASIVIVREAPLEPQVAEGVEPELEGEKPAPDKAGE
ncbi:MAG TPA: 50S ribosomal protein L25 [Pyrinomonadaceae bacterium]|nr:50S ribosomal protein L25 [Pyrinomonadaceae bacterium]